jgi:hypothetical protein
MSRHCVSARYLRDGLLSRVGPRPSPVGPGLRHARAFAVLAGVPAWRGAGAGDVGRAVRETTEVPGAALACS